MQQFHLIYIVLCSDVGVVAPPLRTAAWYLLVCCLRYMSHVARPQPPSQSPALIGEQPPISNFYTWMKFFATLSFYFICKPVFCKLIIIQPCYSVVSDFCLTGTGAQD
jgi:hypothetical protein